MTFIFSENVLGQSDLAEKVNLRCFKCSKDYINLKNFQKHLENCPGQERPFACDSCDYRAKLKHHLKLHVENMHLKPKGANPEHACPHCQRRYHRKHSLVSHLRYECGF